ncbi:MAG: hypothetical protein C0486_07275 [Erythrobacter sp.]|nr:hypothetical protein [Erythrobacter sp.]
MRILQRLVLPLLLLLFSGGPALAQGAVWTVSEAKGVVTVIDSQGTRPAKVGAPLAPGATVRTAARASAVLVRGKEFVTMRQNAQLRIAPAQRERGIVQILQDYGSALFNIGKQPNPHFGVDTPYLAAVVKGTTFVITVTNEGASLQVTEGAVETSTLDGGAVELITPGNVAMIAAADPLRMVVGGEGRKVMDSPARGTAPAPSAAAPAPAAGGAAEPAAPPSRQALPEPALGAPDTSPRIDQAILSTPQDLGRISNGFAGGEVVVLAAVMVSDVRGEGNAGGNSGEGTDGGSGGRPDDGVVCAGGTCTGGGAGGGADNGNPPEGAGDGNGGGADNGNPPEGAGDGDDGGADNGNPPEGAGDGNGGGSDNDNPPEGAGDGDDGGADNGNPPEGAGDGDDGGADNGNPPEGAGDGDDGGADNGNPPEGAGDGDDGGADNGNRPEGAGDGNGGGADNGNPRERAGGGDDGGLERLVIGLDSAFGTFARRA